MFISENMETQTNHKASLRRRKPESVSNPLLKHDEKKKKPLLRLSTQLAAAKSNPGEEVTADLMGAGGRQ